MLVSPQSEQEMSPGLGEEGGAPPPRPKYACLLDLVVGGGPGC